MKKHILLGTSLLLTLGTAVAGTFMYGQGSSAASDRDVSVSSVAEVQPSPATMAMWKATASSSDYVAPKVPI